MTVAYNDLPLGARESRGGVFGRIAGFFNLLDRSIAAANTYENLSLLSDEQLAARGLTRPEIANAARKVLLGEA
jgi:hypothetical protein